MLTIVLEGSYRLDAWLKEHLGRLYNIVLGVGLGLGISAAANNLTKEFGEGLGAWKFAGLIAFQLLLLVNQIAQLHEMREARRRQRAAKQG